MADVLPFEKLSKGSVSFTAADFKPVSCPCPYSQTVVPEGSVQTHYLWLSTPLRESIKMETLLTDVLGQSFFIFTGAMRCSNVSLTRDQLT